jgi:drug/metabolite transporter (DMT)-like permease
LISFGVTYHEQKEPIPYAAFWAIFLACVCPISFASSGLMVRVVNYRLGVEPEDFTQAYYIFMSMFLTIGCILAFVFDNYEFSIGEFIQIIVAGIMAGLGGICLSRAITIGYAGIVYSLINAQVIFQTILDVLILFQIPNSYEIVAAVLGIIGS